MRGEWDVVFISDESKGIVRLLQPVLQILGRQIPENFGNMNKMLTVQYPEIPRWCVELACLIDF